MKFYDEIIAYMRNLANQNVVLLPDISKAGKIRNFITMDVEELVLGAAEGLPTGNNSPFMVWVNHQTQLRSIAETRDSKVFQFFILQQFEHDNFAKQNDARANTEKVARQLLNRMAKDSREGFFWKHGFDKVVANINPVLKKESAVSYVGWAVDFNTIFHYSGCVEAISWHDGGTPPPLPPAFVSLSNTDGSWTAEVPNGTPYTLPYTTHIIEIDGVEVDAFDVDTLGNNIITIELT